MAAQSIDVDAEKAAGTPERAPHELWHRWFAAMMRGDIESAWTVNDEVLASHDPATRDDRSQPYHQRWVWDGRPFDSRDVLVRCYHGLGDTLQFARLLPRLRDRTRSVRVEVQPALLPLLRFLPGIELIPFHTAWPTKPSECDIEIMELAHALRAGPAAVAPPYIEPPLDSFTRMRFRLGGRRPRSAPLVALCWRGGDWSCGRSLPLTDLTACIPDGVDLVNLQGADGNDEARREPRFANDEPLDVADAAAAIMLADLVVTVDTMVAHLAGALGRPLWLLLPTDCDWRWGRAGDRSPWYPTAHLYRQPHQGDWRAPLARLAADLRHWKQMFHRQRDAHAVAR